MAGKAKLWYHLVSRSSTPGYPSGGWLESMVGKEICPKCRTPLEGAKQIDAYLEYMPDRAAINIITAVGIGYASWELLETIGKDVVDEFLYLGKLFGPEDTLLSDYVTFNSKEKIVIRGSNPEDENQCDCCGVSLLYPLGRWWISEDDLKGSPIYKSHLFNQLLINEELYDRIEKRKWKKMGVEKIKIV